MKRFLILFTMMIFTLSAEYGWEYTKLTTNLPSFSRDNFALSPDKKYLVSTITRNPNNFTMDVVITNTETGEERTIATEHEFYLMRNPILWLHDSKHVFYSKGDANNPTYLLHNIETDSKRELITDFAVSSISLDAEYLAYSDYSKDLFIKNMYTDSIVTFEFEEYVDKIFRSVNSSDNFYVITRTENESPISGRTYSELFMVNPMSGDKKLIYDKLVDNSYSYSGGISYTEVPYVISINNEERVLFRHEPTYYIHPEYIYGDSIYSYYTKKDSTELLFSGVPDFDPIMGYTEREDIDLHHSRLSEDGTILIMQLSVKVATPAHSFNKIYYCDLVTGERKLVDKQYEICATALMWPTFLNDTSILIASKSWEDGGNGNEEILKAQLVNGIEENNFVESNILLSNYPNPFNPTTTISYTLNEPSNINISVFNLKGEFIRELYNGYKADGNHSVKFDGAGLNSGIYYTVLRGDNNKSVRKMILCK